MITLNHGRLVLLLLLILLPITVIAQVQNDPVPLKSWQAPLYWQPSAAEDHVSRARVSASGEARLVSADDITSNATIPVGALVFVAMTPCRIVDTRVGFPAPFPWGPPGPIAGVIRTIPITTAPTCVVPSNAMAYSFNVALQPRPLGTSVVFVTVGPTPIPNPPPFSTVNDPQGTIIANAAIVPAGAGVGGPVDVYASGNTDIIIDVNGYYAPERGVTLALGNAAAPSLSFDGDPNTGAFSPAANTLALTTNGAERMRVDAVGRVGIADTSPATSLEVGTGSISLSDLNGALWFKTQDFGTSSTHHMFIGSDQRATTDEALTVAHCNVANAFDNISNTASCGSFSRALRIQWDGNLFATAYNTGGADFAELVEPAEEADNYTPGDVLVIASAADGRVALASQPYSQLVAGIYSTKPGIVASPYHMDDPRLVENQNLPLAVIGIVPVKVTAENGAIAPGDLLVTSSTPGHAMKGTDRDRMLGAIVGKALGALREGEGVIRVLVTLQ